MVTGLSMLTLNNCEATVDMPVWHIAVEADNYFDNRLVEQHMRIIFNEFNRIEADMESHTFNVTAGKSEAERLVPQKIRQLLKSDV